MFVYYYVQVAESFAVVERKLLGILGGLGDMARAAYREGEVLRTKIGVGSSTSPLLAKTVEIEVGTPLRGESESEIPITWRATGTPGLFPSMEAGIVIARLGPSLTQISLRGSYEPPLGAVGRALDRTLFHRVAEASVKSFLDHIASSVQAGDLRPAIA